jgi:hypothetical protein
MTMANESDTVTPSDLPAKGHLKLLRVLGECLLKLVSYKQPEQFPDAVFDLSDQKNMLVHWSCGDPWLGVSPHATASRLRQAHWQRRPSAAKGMPPQFRGIVIDEAVWQFVQSRSTNPMAELMGQVFHFQRMPNLPLDALRESQVALICGLASTPCSWDTLRQSLPEGESERSLARDLHALLACQAIRMQAQALSASQSVFIAWRKGLAWVSESAQMWGRPQV